MSQIPSYWDALGLRVGPSILAFYSTYYRSLGKFKICTMNLQERIQYIKQVSPVSGNNLNNTS